MATEIRQAGGPVVYRHALRLALNYLIAIAIGIIMVFPLLWMFSGALKTKELLLEETVINLIPPLPWQWHNFIDAWTALAFTRFLINTLIITVASMFGGLLSASMVAYGFARLRFVGRNFLFFIVLGTMMVPMQVTAIPNLPALPPPGVAQHIPSAYRAHVDGRRRLLHLPAAPVHYDHSLPSSMMPPKSMAAPPSESTVTSSCQT